MRAAITLLALAVAAPALADDAPKDWHRATSPDGRASVMTPCAASELRNVEQADGYRVMCLKDGMLFVVTSGIPSIDSGEIVTYEMQLSQSRKNLKPPEFTENPVEGFPAFQIVCTGNGGVPCIMVIDHRPGRPLVAGAMAEGGPGTGDPAKQAEYQVKARYFYQSLKVSGK